jgi:hypothetical protein
MNRTFARVLFLSILITLGYLDSVLAQQNQAIDDKDVAISEYQDVIYPTIAVAGNIEGVVVVRVALDDQRKVLEATALSGTALLIRPSVENAKKLRLESNSKKSAIIVYNFKIQGYCHNGPSAMQTILYPPNLIAVTACRRPMMP